LCVCERERERAKLDFEMPDITRKYLQCANFPKDHINASRFGGFCLTVESCHSVYTNAQKCKRYPSKTNMSKNVN